MIPSGQNLGFDIFSFEYSKYEEKDKEKVVTWMYGHQFALRNIKANYELFLKNFLWPENISALKMIP